MSTVDGRARLGELARPLLERIPAGIYRELLGDEVAKVVRLIRSAWRVALDHPRASQAAAAATGNRAPARPRQPVGRPRNLVRQAIQLAGSLPANRRQGRRLTALAPVDRPGIPLLIGADRGTAGATLRNDGALLERWRGRPDVEHLAKLATLE